LIKWLKEKREGGLEFQNSKKEKNGGLELLFLTNHFSVLTAINSQEQLKEEIQDQ